MKVLITTPDWKRDGGVINLFRILDKHFTENISYFTIGSRTDRQNVLKTLFYLISDTIKFFFTLKKSDYDIVHINPSLANKSIIRDGLLLLLAKLSGKKVVLFFHGWDEPLEVKIKKKYLGLFRAVYSKADSYIVLGKIFKQKLEAMGCNRPTFFASPAVADHVFERKHVNLMNHENDSTPTKKQLLFLSRLDRNKGTFETIKAYSILKKNHPEISLKVVGKGPELENAREYVKKHSIEDVVLTGFVDDETKYEILSESYMFVFPTKYGEGMPANILEAMASGLPVLTRAVGGLKNFFENEKMGYITESVDPVEIARLIEKLISDRELHKRVSQYNYEYANTHFRASVVATTLEEIYKHTIS